MNFLKLLVPVRFPFVLGSLVITACSGGLDGGSIISKFVGIGKVNVLGPETVEVSWPLNDTCNSYKVFDLSSNTSDALVTVSVPPVKIKTPNIQSDHAYTFAVGCVDSTGTASGLNFKSDFVTWKKFSGVVRSHLDETGVNPLIDLSWDYNQPGVAFSVYAKISSVPGDLATWGLSQPGGYGSQYSETPICQTYGNELKIGNGGTCNPPDLVTGNIYDFKVVAKYPDGSYSTDIVGNGTSILMPSSFTPPDCVLTREGLGADSSNSYLFLRCSSATASGGCAMPSISVTAYQAVNGVRTVISDTLNGPGTLRIQPRIAVNATNDRVVKDLEIEYVCRSTSPATKAIARYDGTTTQLLPPALKYGSTGYETAPAQAYVDHPSYLGSAVAIGDFNCDGKPDLAVGLPRISYTASPYLNQNSESGAVKIYYDYAVSATGAISANNSQYLSFRDLPSYAHFGQSLAVGNINKDVHNDAAAGKFFACDDLIIGAPGSWGARATRGSAYIFYGQPQGFPQPVDSSGLATNLPTCSGTITNQVCAPVHLAPDMTADFHISPDQTEQNNVSDQAGAHSQVGASVAYIRDFNADGYGDVAIGDPNCRWDGEAMNNYIIPTTHSAAPPPTSVGCVYVYWGGPSGLQNLNLGPTFDSTINLNSTYVKIYPPIPQDGMHFGASISGGGDVDGRLPVPVALNGTAGVILASGDDFVVGAPDFKYSNTSPELGDTVSPTWTVNETISTLSTCNANGGGGACPVDPVVLQGPASYAEVKQYYLPKITPPWNGAWNSASGPWTGLKGFPASSNSALSNSTGIAFLYLGRSAYRSYDLSLITNSSTQTNNLTRYPNGVTGTPNDPVEQLLSKNLQDRQNGSQYLSVAGSTSWQNAPSSSFYNCGNRGGPQNPLVDGSNRYFKHMSCLAGRNNFSIIYPTVNGSSGPVNQFGANLTIGGTKEQNAVALYQLGSNITASAYTSVPNSNFFDLAPLAQGNTHDRIRGSSLWELGVKGLTVTGAADQNCELTNNPTGPSQYTASCSSYVGRLSRSIIDESYSFPSSSWVSTPNALPLTDINRDGYADVVVSANNKVFTYFGNYAADFSYQGTSYSTSATCSVGRSTAGLSAGLSSNRNTGVPTPYSTFSTRASVMTSPTQYTITGQYPQFILPGTGNYSRLSYLDDTLDNSSTSLTYDYPTVSRSTASTYALNNCLPQVKSYSVTPSSMTATDLNNDGIVDVAIGLSSFNSSAGQQIASLSGQNGNGLALDASYIANSSGAKLGSSVATANWKFIDESSRRDLISGAVGSANGSGAIYAFSGSGSSTISPNYSYQFTENSNTPNALSLERSKIIGDVNGDGFDDLLVPVKRFGVGGSIYYDAIIYYGSSFGPVTYNFCTAKMASIKTLNGSAISLADCQGSVVSQIAVISGTQVRLPQYLPRPSGIGAFWAKEVFAVGDVNRDSYQDIVVLDGSINDDVGGGGGANALYLFFGSSSGLINGPPSLGSSASLLPQLVSSNTDLVGYGAGSSAWNQVNNGAFQYQNRPETQYPVVHGDFNGDGFEDLALGLSGGNSPTTSNNGGRWTCNAADAGERPGYCSYSGTPPSTFISPYGANPFINHGYVVVFYGGNGGYQTPTSSTTGVATEFEGISAACSNGYETCTYAATGSSSLNTISSVYGNLTYDSGSSSYLLDGTKTACATNSGLGSTAYSCKASLIRNPVFSDSTNGGEWSIAKTGFGASLTVADINHDGIDDLVVGQPQYDLTQLSNLSSGSLGVYSSVRQYNTLSDSSSHGAAFIYYGAKSAGLVAPAASKMIGDAALGLNASIAPMTNSPVFQVYPYFATNTLPPLDQSQNARNFAAGMSTGDFNADGYDDVAFVSGNGQVYVYYGPICQPDNSLSNAQIMHTNPNVAKAYDAGASDPPPTPLNCTLLNFNATFSSSGTTSVSPISSFAKTLHPQMITVSGSNRTTAMGSTILSARPTRATASTQVLKNSGNLNGDAEGTSDLVLGTYLQNDPNISASNTGVGYIFFGHKATSGGSLPTTPGLYAGGSATYNGNITSQTVGGSTVYYYTPIVLKPHTADGATGSFFFYQSSLGDLNGDGTADLLMPTRKISTGSDGTTVIDGGGFKLFY